MKSLSSKYLSPQSIALIGVLFLMAVYFLGARPWLSSSAISMIELTLLGGFAVDSPHARHPRRGRKAPARQHCLA
jgi:hypothetical protein